MYSKSHEMGKIKYVVGQHWSLCLLGMQVEKESGNIARGSSACLF